MNFQESAVDRLLADYASENGYRIHLKMRLRDVIDVDDVTQTARDRNFAFTSHLDFVAVDAETLMPVLAIEYDGAQHLSDPAQIERDRIKNRLCEAAGLPLLRIDSLFTRKEGKWRVLTYILWAHETGKAFYAAQESGQIPWDEPFYHGSVIDVDESGRAYDFTGLDIPAMRFLDGFRSRHRALWERQWWRGTETQIEARDVLALPNGQFLAAHCAIRDFAIDGISALDIASELSTAELGWLAQQYDDGDAVAINAEQGARLLNDIGAEETDRLLKSSSGWHMRSGWGPASSEG